MILLWGLKELIDTVVIVLGMESDRMIRLTRRPSNRTALIRGNHVVFPARVRHIRAEALQQRIRHPGEECDAGIVQAIDKDININHGNAPRPWGMQPNTSFRLRMCLSPLMFWVNIIPFSPCTDPLQMLLSRFFNIRLSNRVFISKPLSVCMESACSDTQESHHPANYPNPSCPTPPPPTG